MSHCEKHHQLFDACSECVKDLQQRLAAAEAKIPKWIPLSEQLPPEDVRVLFFDGDNTMKSWRHHVDVMVGKDCVRNYLHNYTHWMPLPEAPGADHG